MSCPVQVAKIFRQYKNRVIMHERACLKVDGLNERVPSRERLPVTFFVHFFQKTRARYIQTIPNTSCDGIEYRVYMYVSHRVVCKECDQKKKSEEFGGSRRITGNCRHPRREPDILNVPTYGHDKNYRALCIPTSESIVSAALE